MTKKPTVPKRKACLSWVMMLIACLSGPSQRVMAQQPAGTYNVRTDGTAQGDGTSNDTAAIQSALDAAKAAGKNVYFPDGTYVITGRIDFPSNIRISGDKGGVSSIKATGTHEDVRIEADGGTTGNLTVEDMFFLNIGFLFPKTGIANVTVSRCVMAADAGGQGWMMYELGGDDMVVEDSIFLTGHHEGGEWLGTHKALRVEKAKRMRINRNIFGLDMGNLSWLATEWEGHPNWSDPLGRLLRFKEDQGLPRRMGEMSGAIAIFNGDSNVIDRNIIHLDFDANLAGGLDEDHLIYAIRETRIEITRNWLSGHPNTAGGGLKHRDTEGPGVIAANYLNDTPLLLYSYGDDAGSPIDHLYPFDNQLVFRNYLKVTPERRLPGEITGGSARYSFNYMSTDGNRGMNIDVAENLFDLDPNIQNQGINLAQGRTGPDEWRIYESNFHVSGANAGELVAIIGRNLTPGAYTYHTLQAHPAAPYLASMNADMAKYEAMEIPYLDIPAYGADPVVISGYTAWLAAFPSISGDAPETDSDDDGMTNLMEFALGGNPIIRDAATVLPGVHATPAGALFTLRRSDASETGTEMTFQYTQDFSSWTDVVIGESSSGPDSNGVQVTVEENDSDPDVIRIFLPAGAGRRAFGRIRLSVMP